MAKTQRAVATGIQKYKTAAGDRWRVRYRDPAGRQRSKTFRSREEADNFQKVNGADLVRNTWIDTTNRALTFERYALDTYLPSRDWAPSTTEQAEIHLRKWIIPILGTTPLARITPTQLDELTVRCRKADLADSTIEIVYTRATNVLKAAAADGLIHSAPVGTQRPRRGRVRYDEEVIPLTRDQVNELAGNAGPHVAPFVWTLVGAGLRPGEAAGLTADRINFETLEITVDRALKTPNAGAVYLGPPKTDASRRIVPIGERLAEILTRHLGDSRSCVVGDDILVFSSRRGSPLRRSTLADYWKQWCPEGCDARGWHSLRHTYASALLEAGESVVAVQRRLGHASAEETLQTYSHLMPGSDDRSRQALDDYMS